MKACLKGLLLALSLVLPPALAAAQNLATGAITGVVRDTSGAVLPGVTVEASSPALIEKVRTVVTDGQGVYRIIDLRPGAYTVTFTLQGFSTLRREGVELTTGFTATVNGELGVGNLTETVTVASTAPLVDTQNVTQQTVLPRLVTESLPLGSGITAYATMLPGANISAAATDVGGSKGEYLQPISIHGGRGDDFQQLRDGMYFGTMMAAGNWMTSLNPATVAETTLTTSTAMAEQESGGVLINVIPREGGNIFSGTFNGDFSRPGLQSDNLDDGLKARGLTTAPRLRTRYDVGGGIGGPIRQDRLWFFASSRSWRTSTTYPGNWFNATAGTLFYTPDFDRPAYDNSWYKELRGQVTWQASSKDKITAMAGNEWNCDCASTVVFGNASPETAAQYATDPSWQASVKWTRPQTSRLLLEVSSMNVFGALDSKLFGAGGEAGGSVDDPYVLDSSRNYGYGGVRALGLNGGWGRFDYGQTNQSFSVSYVTGSHSTKVGVLYLWGTQGNDYRFPASRMDQTFIFNGRTPQAVVRYVTPVLTETRQNKVGFFAQDQWTLRRMTLNLGFRFDSLKGSAPAIDAPAGVWVPARSFPAVDDIPNWKDWSPRVGAAYDLFGNGRTAIKGAIGRYVQFLNNAGIISANAPASRLSTSAQRAWSDANGDYIPQESELGPYSDVNFGKLVSTTTYAEDVLKGTGVRPYSWQANVQVNQDLGPGLAVNVGYFHTWYGNFYATENRAVTAANFNTYCVTAPTNALLPGGGGNQICGLFDVVPARFGQSDSYIDLASKYGDQSEVHNGVDVTLTARLRGGRYAQAGLSTGSTTTDVCYANDKPQLTSVNTPRTSEYCRYSTAWSGGTQFKALVVMPLTWGIQVSVNYQNLAPISLPATASVSNSEIASSLGRDLSACGSRTGAACTARSTVTVVLPNTNYAEPRFNQLDLRFGRLFRLPGGASVRPQVDLFNALNNNSVLGVITRLGPAFNLPIQVLDPRVVKFGVDVSF
jgi:hypothetical protein